MDFLDKYVKLIRSNVLFFKDTLKDIYHEQSGLIDTNGSTITTECIGTACGVSGCVIADDSGIISWHSHPSNFHLEDEIKKNLEKCKNNSSSSMVHDILAIPGSLDFSLIMDIYLIEHQRSIDVVISDKGFCFYFMNDEMMDGIDEMTKEEIKKFFGKKGKERSRIERNLDIANYEIFCSKKIMETATKSFENILNIDAGFVIKFFEW
jgi:hypothetical protein